MTDRTLEKLAEGVELAKAAKRLAPGQWSARSGGEDWWLETETLALANFKEEGQALAAFIAHCNPEFVLELAREVERQAAELEGERRMTTELRGQITSWKQQAKTEESRAQEAEAELERVRRSGQARCAALANPAARKKRERQARAGIWGESLRLREERANPAAEGADA